jgi:hypothetical protein
LRATVVYQTLTAASFQNSRDQFAVAFAFRGNFRIRRTQRNPTRDGKYYLYRYRRILNRLNLAHGLK